MKLTKQAQITALILFYLLSAAACLLSGLPNINSYQWNIDYSLWGSNEVFIDTIAIWSNLFLFSIAPLVFAIMLRVRRKLMIIALALPLFWGFVLLFAVFEDAGQLGRMMSDFSKVIYGILFISILGASIQFYYIMRKVREERRIERLEKFQQRAIKKLSKLNPEENKKLMGDFLNNQKLALDFLLEANYYEDDEEKIRYLLRKALHCERMAKKSIDVMQKRMARYSKVPGEKVLNDEK